MRVMSFEELQQIYYEAQDEILKLNEENARLREALSRIASEEYGRPTEMMLIARKALENK